MSNSQTSKKLTGGIITVIVLIICLCVTTFALVWATLSIENNVFKTGSVKINLNDGKPIIDEHEFLFEPGMTVKKDFFVQNESNCDVYYKLYFNNLSGDLSRVIKVTVSDGENVLYSVAADNFEKEDVAAADTLKIGQRKELSIYFYYPENSGNETQNKTLSFDLNADAVQTKNNADKRFD